MYKIFLVGIGGFLGSAARYMMTEWMHRLSNQHWFPFGTFVCNILGCFLIGLTAGVIDLKHVGNEQIRLFLVVGILGGFTTFSSFGHESVNLFRDAQNTGAMLYILSSVILCLSSAWLGYYLATRPN